MRGVTVDQLVGLFSTMQTMGIDIGEIELKGEVHPDGKLASISIDTSTGRYSAIALTPEVPTPPHDVEVARPPHDVEGWQ